MFVDVVLDLPLTSEVTVAFPADIERTHFELFTYIYGSSSSSSTGLIQSKTLKTILYIIGLSEIS